jgi:hypothetical protein
MAEKTKGRGPDYVQVHLSRPEKEAIDAQARASGIPRSTWMRYACLDAVRRRSAYGVTLEVPHGD